MKKALFFPWQVSLCTISYLCASNGIANAQVTSDGTVNTQVNQNGNVSEIIGGERRGDNLFHSFQDFSVPTGNEAFFNNNANNISNIFSRVTGGNISNIDGAIRANGTANLFLINPAGIIFGENARLDIGGSFYGSTASSVLFEEGEFSAVDNLQQPVLTVNAPIGLGFRDNPGEIVNNSLANNAKGLEVKQGKALSLLGGNITFNGGIITAPGGIVELGGISQSGEIGINEDASMSFPENVERADVSLTNNAKVNVQAEGGGFININVRNLTLSEQSEFLAGISSNSISPEAQAGNITINATRNISLSDGSLVSNKVNETAIGNGGNIEISTNFLELTEGSKVQAQTFGQGNAGNVSITVEDRFILDRNSTIISQVREEAIQGDSGNIEIDTGFLELKGESLILANTRGNGNAGDIIINANTTMFLENSLISSGVNETAIGNGGNIEISANSLELIEGSRLLAQTFGQGNGGNINIIVTNKFTLDRDSAIFTQVREEAIQGDSGNIEIDTGFLELKGETFILANTRGNGNAGNISIQVEDDLIVSEGSLIRVGVNDGALGNAGELSIDASQIFLSESAISSSVEGEGMGGDINISADSISLEAFSFLSANTGNNFFDGGKITIDAQTLEINNGSNILTQTNGEGNAGNIDLNISQLIILDGQNTPMEIPEFELFGDRIISNLERRTGILADATQNSTGNGGNINIKSQFIIAFPDGNSDIIANAFSGNGGNITIATEGIFGIQESPSNSLTNDITASSDAGISGNITITTPDINPVQGVTELPNNVVTPEETTQQTCEANREIAAKNGLNISGKGGILPEPGLPLNSLNVTVNGETNPISSSPQAVETSRGKILPARGIELTESGEVILTAYRTDNSGARVPEIKQNCDRI